MSAGKKTPGEKDGGDSLSSWGPTTPQPKSFLRRFRWLIVAGSIVVLLLLLVALAPTLASMGWAKSIILGQINDQLNGTVEAGEWDLNWWGGIEIRQVRIFDKHHAQLAEMKRLSTELSVMDIIKGDYYTLGKTKVEGLALDFKQNKDGTTNFSDLVKPPPGPKPAGAKPDSKPFKMPDLKGDFDIDFRGTLAQEDKDGNWQKINVDRSSIKLKVPDINKALSHQIDIDVRDADNNAGHLVASGSVKLFDNFVFDSDRFNADENAELQNLPLASFLPFIDAKQLNKLTGNGNSKIAIKMAGVDDITIEGNTTIDNFAIGGPATKGDTFAAKKFILEIPKTSFARGNGRIKTGESAAPTPIVIRFDENSIILALDATAQTLQNVAANNKPGADGQLSATIDVQLKALASQLPHLLDLPEGVTIDAGHLKQVANITFSPDKAVIKQVLDLADLRGTRAGKPISAKPIHLAVDATSLGGGGTIPDIRNFVIGLTSSFATINGTGESLARHHVDGDINLAEAKNELGQFSAFLSKAEMKGNVQFKLDTTGDLTRGQTPQMDASLTARDLVLKNIAEHEIREDWLSASAKGKLVFDDNTVLKAVRDAAVNLKTSRPEKPSMDINATGDIALAPFAVPKFEVKQSTIDLPAIQREFAAFIPPTKVTFPTGTIQIAAIGKMDAAGATLSSLRVNPQDLTIVQADKTILKNYTGTLEMLGDVRHSGGAGGAIDARISKLSLTDKNQILEIEKSGDGDLVFSLAPDGSFTGNGKLNIKNADLKALTDIAQPDSQIKAGNLSGTLELVRAEKGQTLFVGDLAATHLTIDEPQRIFQNQDVNLSLRANADDKFSLIKLTQLDLKSAFAKILFTDTIIRRPMPGAPVAPLDMFEQARMSMDVPDLARAIALVQAFIPPSETTTPKKLSADPPTRDRDTRDVGSERISSGPRNTPIPERASSPDKFIVEKGASAKGTVVLSRSNGAIDLKVEELSGRQIGFKYGKGAFAPRDILLNLALALQPAPNTDASKPFSEQLPEIRVTRLDGNLGFATIGLDEPIAIKNLTGQMEVAGAIKASGGIEPLGEILEVLQVVAPGTFSNYHGSYSLTQRITTKENTLSATGKIDLNDFKVGRASNPDFQERLLNIANELSLDQKANALTINNLSLNMQDSKALGVQIKDGKITDLEKNRDFENLKLILSYDAAKVWEIVRPMLTEEQQKQFKDLKLAGIVKDRQFMITGSYPEAPKNKKGAERNPLEFITAWGSLFFDQIDYQGMLAEGLELPLYFNKGILQTIDKDHPNTYPKPAKYSGGTMDLAGLQIDLLADHPRVTSLRKNYALLDNVEIKREFVETYLGSSSPLFTGTEDARGKISVTVDNLSSLPLDETLIKPKKRDTGQAQITFSITDLRIKNKMMRLLGSQLKMKVNSDGTISADIKDAKIGVEDGKVTSDITLNFGGQPLGNKGTVRLRDEHIEKMSMFIPRDMLSAIPGIKDVRLLKEMIEVPVSGTLHSPQLDIAGAALKAVNPTNILDNLIPKPKGVPGIIGR